MDERLAPADAALQHGRAPRPLPLFLQLVREVARDDEDTARRALDGLARYGREARAAPRKPRPAVATVGPATLRDHGGRGPAVVLIPSLINPPHVLDLPGQSLAAVLAVHHRTLLLDWGGARARAGLDLGGHVETLLVPLLRKLDEVPMLVGYCLGGTMALAAANLVAVPRIATLAAPWRFDAYPAEALAALRELWRHSAPLARGLGVLPTEVLQAAFWSLDPRGVVAKFAALASAPRQSEAVSRFVTLEDWANDGEPVPIPAARELIERLFLANCSGNGNWRVGGTRVRPDAAPALHFTARGDRIVPEASAPPGPLHPVASGHVGMVVGGRAPAQLHAPLLRFLGQAA